MTQTFVPTADQIRDSVELDAIDKLILTLRYGYDNGGAFRSVTDVARTFEVSRSELRQREIRAMRSLRREYGVS